MQETILVVDGLIQYSAVPLVLGPLSAWPTSKTLPPMLRDHHGFGASQVDQPPEAVLRVFRSRFHRAIPAMLSAILAKFAQDATAAVARDVRSEAVTCPRGIFRRVPADWERPHKSSERNGRPLPPIENRLDDLWREQRKAQDARHV